MTSSNRRCVDRRRPAARPRCAVIAHRLDALAFYGVLLSDQHEHACTVGERIDAKVVVVGQRHVARSRRRRRAASGRSARAHRCQPRRSSSAAVCAGARRVRRAASCLAAIVESVDACRPGAPASRSWRTRSSCSCRPCNTTASTTPSLAAGSRNGPAGNSQPLPKPRSSISAISMSRARRRCCRPSSATITSQPGCACSNARAASTRSAPTATGACVARAISSGSSPTSSGAVVGLDQARGTCRSAVAARDHAGLPAAPGSKARTSAIVSGVLPVPPAYRLPTTTTGTPTRSARSQPDRIRGATRQQRSRIAARGESAARPAGRAAARPR